jgi:protein CpxP
MSDTTQQPRRRVLRRAAIATLIAGLAGGLGFKAFADGERGDWHRGGGYMGAPLDPAQTEARVNRMLGHLYVDINATEEQKQKIDPIVKSAAKELIPLRQQMRTARKQAMELFTKETIDRAAIEKLRAEQIKLAEQASKRFTQALTDVAELLTPAQRQELAERMSRFGGWRGRHGRG